MGACEVAEASFKWSKAAEKSDEGEGEGEGEGGAKQKETEAILSAGGLDARDRASSSGLSVDGPGTSATLENVSVSMPPGQLSLVVGATGCGKSSLLAGLLGDIKRVDGNSSINGKVTLCNTCDSSLYTFS